MAEFNTCAKLVNNDVYKEVEQIYNDLLENKKDPYQFMLDMQEDLQNTLAEKYPDRNIKPSSIETTGELYDWIHNQKIAIDDEFSELVSAIPGMSLPEKERSGIWKKWKSNYHEIRNKKVTELSADDLLELLFEKIDQNHFNMNIDLALKLDAKTSFILYVIKNLENVRRYKTNY
jgi:hypothetical protein